MYFSPFAFRKISKNYQIRSSSYLYKSIFNRVKKIIPKISETEIIALRSGGTSIDRELFSGKIDYKKLFF